MIVLLVFAFLSGIATIAAPCIWPLLPIVLSASSLGGRRRPLGLTLGILLSFGTLTLFISYAVRLLGFDASLLRTLAVIILVVMGITLLWPPLGRVMEASVSRFTGGGAKTGSGDGFWPGFISGLPLGVVWAPCAGPILATIATLGATRSVGVSIVLVTVSYVVGIGIPLFLFSFAGQNFLRNARGLSKYTGTLQRAFGAVMVITAGLILFNWDTRLEADLLDAVPSYSHFLDKLEGNSAVTKELDKLRGTTALGSNEAKAPDTGISPTPAAPKTGAPADPAHVLNLSVRAPALVGINQWLNLPAGQSSLDLQQLRGKVVLLDFWTYTCINCLRTLPHVTAWYDKYRDNGFVVIGVHTPEFQFEHDTSNVQQAIQRLKIPYPVAQDNDYGTWKAFGNRYWPAEYLIDRTGIVRRVDFGEGGYDKMEQAIRELVAQGGVTVPADLTGTQDLTPVDDISPETYVGAARMANYNSPRALVVKDYTNLQLSPKLNPDTFDFGGDWSVKDEFSQSGANAKLEFSFLAGHVYLVMHKPDDGIGTVKVQLDGAPLDDAKAGADVHGGSATIDSDRLYDLVDLKDHPGRHLLHLDFSPGIQVFAFTFG